MDDSPLFVLHGNGTVLNRGCQAIAVGTTAILQREFPLCRLIHASYLHGLSRSQEPRTIEGFPVVPWALTRRYSPGWFAYQFRKLVGRGQEPVLSLLADASVVLECGGDLFTLDYGLPTRQFNIAQAVLDAGRPFVLWGATIGPFSKEPEFERFAGEQLKRFTLICARESVTVEYLDSLGVRENVCRVADPAFALEGRELDLDEEGLAVLRQPCVGLNFSSLIARYQGDIESWTDQVARIVRAVARAVDMPIVLVPHVFTPDCNDLLFLRRVLERTDDASGRITLIDKAYTARELKFIISRLAAFAGARTHATIGSLSSLVPTLSVSYSAKAVGINRDIFGNLDWVLSWKQAAPDVFVEKVQSLLAQAPAVRAHLARVIPAMRESAYRSAGVLRDRIAGLRAERQTP